MSGRNRWKNLKKRMPKARQEKVDAATSRLQAEYMVLQDLRKSLGITQEELAHLLDISQHVVSKMENGHNMYITTLHRIIEAMGGRLKLIAQFPDREVIIDQFGVE